MAKRTDMDLLIRYHQAEARRQNSLALRCGLAGKTYPYRKALSRAALHLRWVKLLERIVDALPQGTGNTGNQT